MNYYKELSKLEEKFLSACDTRLQMLDEMGWNDSSMDINTIKDKGLKAAAKWLRKNGFEAVNEMEDCMEDALECDLDLPIEEHVANAVRVKSVWVDGYALPVIHLTAYPSITHPTIFFVDVTPGENGGEAWLRLSDKACAKCLDSLDGAKKKRLTDLPVKTDLTEEEDESRTEELYLSGDYGIDISIDWNGAIRYCPRAN